MFPHGNPLLSPWDLWSKFPQWDLWLLRRRHHDFNLDVWALKSGMEMILYTYISISFYIYIYIYIHTYLWGSPLRALGLFHQVWHQFLLDLLPVTLTKNAAQRRVESSAVVSQSFGVLWGKLLMEDQRRPWSKGLAGCEGQGTCRHMDGALISSFAGRCGLKLKAWLSLFSTSEPAAICFRVAAEAGVVWGHVPVVKN